MGAYPADPRSPTARSCRSGTALSGRRTTSRMGYLPARAMRNYLLRVWAGATATTRYFTLDANRRTQVVRSGRDRQISPARSISTSWRTSERPATSANGRLDAGTRDGRIEAIWPEIENAADTPSAGRRDRKYRSATRPMSLILKERAKTLPELLSKRRRLPSSISRADRP